METKNGEYALGAVGDDDVIVREEKRVSNTINKTGEKLFIMGIDPYDISTPIRQHGFSLKRDELNSEMAPCDILYYHRI